MTSEALRETNAAFWPPYMQDWRQRGALRPDFDLTQASTWFLGVTTLFLTTTVAPTDPEQFRDFVDQFVVQALIDTGHHP